MIAGLFEGMLHQSEVDGRHLGSQDGITGLLHLLGEHDFLKGIRRFVRAHEEAAVLALFLFDRSFQRAQTDTDGAQVRSLVDLDHGIGLVVALQDLAYLIGGDGVDSAAETKKLYQLQIFLMAHVLGCVIQTGMIAPLVQDPERTLKVCLFGDRILRQHGHIQFGNDLIQSVIDLRIDMIGPACQNDAVHLLFPHLFEDLGSLVDYIRMILSQFLICGIHRVVDLSF